MLSSILPWLTDPLYGSSSAWGLPIDIGWQFHPGLLNYGVLCLIVATYSLLVGYANWKPFRGSHYFIHRRTTAGLLCLIPVALFLFQYVLSDLAGIDHLSQHEIQLILIQRHFGYDYPNQLIFIDPFTADTSTIGERIRLLVDVTSIGLLLPCLSAWILLDRRHFSMELPQSTKLRKHPHMMRLAGITIGLTCLVLLGRPPLATLCQYQAKTSLSTGNYEKALGWLNAAIFLNPDLDQTYYFHVERGEAFYFLAPNQLNDDDRAYLAYIDSQQGDNLDGYQQLLSVWQRNHTAPWIRNEMSYTLERLSEFSQPLKGVSIRRPINDDSSLPWLQLLVQIDPSNTYGQYVVGRIQYDLHNYTGCMLQMSKVMQLSAADNIRSSAYTYMALSYAGLGNYLEERSLLLKAVQLDPGYLNNTAREELSGLR